MPWRSNQTRVKHEQTTAMKNSVWTTSLIPSDAALSPRQQRSPRPLAKKDKDQIENVSASTSIQSLDHKKNPPIAGFFYG